MVEVLADVDRIFRSPQLPRLTEKSLGRGGTMMAVVCLIFGLVGSWLLGVAIAVTTSRWLSRNAKDSVSLSLTEVSGLGVLLGIGATSLLLLLESLCGVPLGRPGSFAIAALGWATGLPQILQWRQQRPANMLSESTSALQRCLQCLFGVLFLWLTLQTLQTPQRLWDERAIFGLKTKVLFEDRSIHSESLKDPDFVQYHPRYPLLIPLAELQVCELLGRVDDRISKIIFPLLFLGMCLTFAGVLTRAMSGDVAWLATCLLATVPVLSFWEYGFMCGQADAPVACFHGVAMLYIWDWLRQSRPTADVPIPSRSHALFSLLMGGVFAGLTVFTKDEGIAFLMIDSLLLAGCLLVMRDLSVRDKLQLFGLFTACVLLVITPGMWHRQSLPKTGEMTYFDRLNLQAFTIGIATLGWTFRHLLQRMFFEASTWGLQWWGVVLSALAFPRQLLTLPQLLLAGDLLGAIAAFVVAGMIAPTTVEEHIGGSSHRFLMQLAPVAVLFLVGQVWSGVKKRT